MSASAALRALRREAADRTLFAAVDLADAMGRFGFVQADPIRAPARAQDLILRQRVPGYRAGDLERAYPSLPLVEDVVHVYGFLHRRHRPLLYPRRIARTFHVEAEHPRLRREVLAYLASAGPSHPRAVEQAIARRHPRAAIVNAWGGLSSATTQMLDVLQYRGLLHVVRREAGVRIYALATRDPAPALTPLQRADGLIALLVRLYAPLPKATLWQLTLMLRERALARDALRARIAVALRRGTLTSARVDGIDYLRPADEAPPLAARAPTVRFLAPFDPLVWDRRRFEHLWGWIYRFEAYTPLAKRQRGYYALPLAYDAGGGPTMPGWVNVTRDARGRVAVRAGFVARRPAGPDFRRAFDAEVTALERFLAKDEPAGELA